MRLDEEGGERVRLGLRRDTPEQQFHKKPILHIHPGDEPIENTENKTSADWTGLPSATVKADKSPLLLIVDGSVGRGSRLHVGDFRYFPVTSGVELNCSQQRL